MVVIILPKTWIYVYIYIHTYEYAYTMFFQLYCYVLVKHLNRILYKLSACTSANKRDTYTCTYMHNSLLPERSQKHIQVTENARKHNKSLCG